MRKGISQQIQMKFRGSLEKRQTLQQMVLGKWISTQRLKLDLSHPVQKSIQNGSKILT
jgi:hypothetical protein